MTLDPAAAAALTNAINEGFAVVGHADATAMPRAKGRANSEPAAFEYHVASHLLRIAETRRRRAHAAAVAAGVLFDHEAEPEPVGTSRVVYAGSLVEITVTVAAPVLGVDFLRFEVGLLEGGVRPALIKRLKAKCATETRPAHKFVSGLITG